MKPGVDRTISAARTLAICLTLMAAPLFVSARPSLETGDRGQVERMEKAETDRIPFWAEIWQTFKNLWSQPSVLIIPEGGGEGGKSDGDEKSAMQSKDSLDGPEMHAD